MLSSYEHTSSNAWNSLFFVYVLRTTGRSLVSIILAKEVNFILLIDLGKLVILLHRMIFLLQKQHIFRVS